MLFLPFIPAINTSPESSLSLWGPPSALHPSDWSEPLLLTAETPGEGLGW